MALFMAYNNPPYFVCGKCLIHVVHYSDVIGEHAITNSLLTSNGLLLANLVQGNGIRFGPISAADILCGNCSHRLGIAILGVEQDYPSDQLIAGNCILFRDSLIIWEEPQQLVPEVMADIFEGV